MGIDGTSFDTNPAMILGGIDPGVTPLEMAYAFSTIARDGMRVGGELDSSVGPNNSLEDLSPTGITEVALPDGEVLDGGKDYNQKEMRAIPESVASSVRSILRSNVVGGTGELAQTGSDDAWGKTGTTENNGDAWFCGGTEHFTACVWVGHAQTNTPMETEYAGGPVDGGTFPAIIWSQVMQAVEAHLRASTRTSKRRRRRRTTRTTATYARQQLRGAQRRRRLRLRQRRRRRRRRRPRLPRPRPLRRHRQRLGRRRHRRHRPLARRPPRARGQGREAKRLPAAQ